MISTTASYALLAFLVAVTGGIFPLLFPNIQERYLKLFISLGGGLLLGMSLIHMLPEAAELISDSFGAWFLVGFILLLVLERFVMIHACEEHDCHYHTVGVAAFIGLTIHGLIEGCALASSLAALEIGPVVLMAILVHKAPATFTLTTLLKLGGRSTKQILLYIVGTSLATPIGIFLVVRILELETVPKSLTGILLAVSGGTFLYIAACDLIPELHRSGKEKFRRLAAFMAGIVISFLSG